MQAPLVCHNAGRTVTKQVLKKQSPTDEKRPTDKAKEKNF